MPRTNINYDNTCFYKIVCDDLDIADCYVGHTTDFRKRAWAHKSRCNNPSNPHYNLNVYQFIRNNGGWENYKMVLVETRKCSGSLEACKIERQHIEEIRPTLNSNMLRGLCLKKKIP